MTKGKKILLFGLSALAVGCFMAGCTTAGKYQFDYEKYQPDTEQDYTLDEGVVIDGVADETFWDGLKPLSFTDPESGIMMTTWAYIGENGLYLYAESTDKSVFFSTEKEFYQNDEMEFMIDPRPEYSRSDEGLGFENPLRTDCLQIRVDSEGRNQRYFGRQVNANSYPWATGYFALETAARVDGERNTAEGANGYSVEAFVAWEGMGLTEKPTSVGICPAFNNTDTASDTGRKWFTYKGMSHASPSSYAIVDETGFCIIADDFVLSEPLDMNADDYADSTVAQIIEVTDENTGDALRGEIRSKLGEDGMYFYAVVNDRSLTRYSSSVWSNDGIELYIDTKGIGGNTRFKEGILRVGVDIDEGYAAFVFSEALQKSYASHRKMFVKTNISEYTGAETAFNYSYTYEYEIMIPYAALGLEEVPEYLSFGWAIKSPNELACIKDRFGGTGLIKSDWLYANGHSPYVPNQYYRVYEGVSSVQIAVDDYQGVVGYYTTIFPQFLNGAQEDIVTYSVAAEDAQKVFVDGNKLYAKAEGQYTITAESASGYKTTFRFNVMGTDDSLIQERDDRALDEFRERLQFIITRQENFTFEEEGLTLFVGDSFMDDGLFFTDFYKRYGATNANILGISSSLAAQWVYYAQEAVYPFSPDQVVVHLGTNDIGYQSETQVAATLIYMFDSFHDALPDTTFWWWTIEQHLDWAGNYKAVAVNAAMREYAKDKDWLKIVDSYSAVSNPDGTPNTSMYRDGVHLTAAGYEAVISAMNALGFSIPQRTDTQIVSFAGEGTQESPFLLSTGTDLIRFSAAVTSKMSYVQNGGTKTYASACYRLTQDIDLAGVHFPAIGRCTTGGSHIYDLDVAFTGMFDGDGHIISNLTMQSRWGTLGLFGNAIGATITDVILENVSMSAQDMRIGGLVGRAQDTHIANVTVSGTISGTESVGGIVGIVSGGACTITGCVNRASLTGTLYGTGGIVGDNLNAGFAIFDCSNYGTIKGAQAGGIVGVMRSGGDKTINDCYNYSNVTGELLAGGISSNNLGTISGCYCLESVSVMVDDMGGVVSALPSFIGIEQVVGAISATGSTPQSCGIVDAEGDKALIAFVTVTASGGTVQIIGIENGVVTFSVTANEGHSFAAAFLGETLLEDTTFVYPSENVTLTVICNMSFGGGSGTQQDPFILSSAEHLSALAQAVNNGEKYYAKSEQFAYADACYALGGNIDLAEVAYTPIGSTAGNAIDYAFRGTFDGRGYHIRNLTIASGALHTGLFGNAVGATFSNIVFENVSISVTAMRTAALLGRGNGVTISQVKVLSGTISGTESVGGIVGILASTSADYVNLITDCENHATITGTLYGSGGIIGDTSGNTVVTIERCKNYGAITAPYAGGMIGLFRSGSTSTINDCYNFADISGTAEVGGLVGTNRGLITNSYCLETVHITLGEESLTASERQVCGTKDALVGYLAGNNFGTVTESGLCDEEGLPLMITVTFDAAEGTLPDGGTSVTVEHGHAIGTLPVPVREGYRFDGWYAEETLVTAETVFYGAARTVTLTAHWIEQIDITFDAGEGGLIVGEEVQTVTLTLDAGSTIAQLPSAEKDGYLFVGWYDGDMLMTSETVLEADRVFSARWEDATVETVVTFDANGGSYTDPQQQTQIKLAVGDKIGALPEVEYEGYRLVGWFAQDGTQVTQDSTFSISSVTLTARWTAVTVVTFVAPYGAETAQAERIVDVGMPLGELPVLTLLPGNELIGWYDGEAPVSSETVFDGSRKTVTLTAKDGWDGITQSESLSGAGTQEEPYLIESGADLRYIRAQALAGNQFDGVYFRLLTDIELNGKSFSPIGRSFATPFGGNLDGNGKTVSGLFVDGANSDALGLFGCITNGFVSDLTVIGTVINAKQYAAILTGLAIGAEISDVTVYGSVSGSSYLGGVVGGLRSSPSTITGCRNYAEITSSATGVASAGGIVGFEDNYSGTSHISDSGNYGTISASGSYAGGIIGVLRNAAVSGCYNFGNVSGTVNVGGITGDNRASIADSYCAQDVQITTSAGTYSAQELSRDGTAENNRAGYICGYPTKTDTITGCGLCDADGVPVTLAES